MILKTNLIQKNTSQPTFIISLLLLISFTCLNTKTAKANRNTEFYAFLDNFWHTARKAGIKRDVFVKAFTGIKLDAEVNKAQKNQPEFVTPVWAYIERAVSEKRLELGQKELNERAEILEKIEKKYGVEKQILLAIWGLESTFGQNKGKRDVIKSLATMAFRGKRTKYGRKQLIAALKIIQRGDISLEQFKGSWAGAMGHTQFIPVTYNHYAVDFTGDGKRDIWNSVSDALASTANYLKRAGWQTGKTWGYEVQVPKGYDYYRSGRGIKKTIRQWQRYGIKRVNGRQFPRPDDVAELIVPAGANGPAFLMLKNFRVIMRYNVSVSYALAVGHLGDRLLGYGPFVKPWPKSDKKLKYVEQKELQRLLARKGYKIGKIDGKIGKSTKRALRAFQRRSGLPADGYPSYAVLQRLRQY